jgi:hypothetical protein
VLLMYATYECALATGPWWPGRFGLNWQQGHPRDAAQALRRHPELKSNHRIERASGLRHLELTI